MAFRLDPSRPARDELRRVVIEQLVSGAEALESACGNERPGAIHGARKSVKKARAALRLSRSGLAPRVRRAELGALRDAGRLLAGARDADVLVTTANDLAERYAGQLPATAFNALRREVAAIAGVMEAEDRAEDAAPALRAIAERADTWPLERLTWATVRHDARRIYALGRDEFATARDSDDGDVLHEWRKRVKDLWYQQRLLRDTWSPVLRAYADQADELGEALGDDHDLAVLAAELESRQDQLSAAPRARANARADRPAPRRAAVSCRGDRRAAVRGEAVGLRPAHRRLSQGGPQRGARTGRDPGVIASVQCPVTGPQPAGGRAFRYWSGAGLLILLSPRLHERPLVRPADATPLRVGGPSTLLRHPARLARAVDDPRSGAPDRPTTTTLDDITQTRS